MKDHDFDRHFSATMRMTKLALALTAVVSLAIATGLGFLLYFGIRWLIANT